MNRPHHNCHDAARLLFKFLLYDTCQIRVSCAGVRRETSAKGPNKTVVSYSWAGSQKQKAILMKHTHTTNTNTHTHIDPNIQVSSSQFTWKHANSTLGSLPMPKTDSNERTLEAVFLSVLFFCFLFLRKIYFMTENRIIFT